MRSIFTSSAFFASLSIVVFLLSSFSSSAQLKVDSGARLGIGTDPELNTRLFLLTGSYNHGIKLRTEPADDAVHYGLHNELYSSLGSTNYGMYNFVDSRSDSYSYGIYNRAFHYGSGRNIGLFNYSRHYGSGEHYAQYNLMWYSGSGTKHGIYTFLGDDSSGNSGSTSTLFGTRTKIRYKYFPLVYGHHLEMTRSNYSSSAVNSAYGYYVYMDGKDTNHAYGVYSHVKSDAPDTDDGDYAGYFVGDVSVNGEYVQTSDATLKKNVSVISDALSIIQQLKPTTYTFLPGNRFGYSSTKPSYGFLAQELELVLPNLVRDVHHPKVVRHATPQPTALELGLANDTTGVALPSAPGDRALSEAGAAEDEVLYEAEVLKGIKYIELIPILTQAIKEQQVEIDSLQQLIGSTLGTTVDTLATLSTGVGDNFMGDSKSTQQTQSTQETETRATKRKAQTKLKLRKLATENETLHASVEQLLSRVERLERGMNLLRNCTDCRTGAVPEFGAATLSEGRISIYPNPAQGKVTVNNPLSTGAVYTIRILTADGREYARVQARRGPVKRINTSRWPAGAYVFEISEGGTVLDRLPVVVSQ